MTEIAIQKQIETIRKITEEALKSKETALKFLVDAGIVKGRPASKNNHSEKKK